MAIKPSLRFTLLLLLIHAVVGAAVYATAVPLTSRLAMLLLILLSLLYHLARDALLLFPGSWRSISLNKGSVSIIVRDESSFTGQIANSTFASPHFIVLRIRLEGRRLPASRVIFPDALGTGVFRELCVRLRFG